MTTAHLDYDTLADLAEGLLSDARAASADAHLASCAECRDRSTEIAEVSRLLAAAPVPPMPARLVSRIDDALAAEAGSIMSLGARRHLRRRRALSVAAAAVVMVGGGALAGHTLLTGSESSESSGAQSSAFQDRSASARAQSSNPRALQAPGNGYQTVESGTEYTETGLGEQVSAQLSQPSGREGGSQPAIQAAQIMDCVQNVAKSKIPLLVDVATYESRPATVIVLPGSDAARLDIWVVGPACSASDTALITRTQTAR